MPQSLRLRDFVIHPLEQPELAQHIFHREAELGHHVLEIAGPDAQHQVERLLRSGRALPISLRARKRGVEYFSETLAAYRFEDSLADKDPEGYDMVEAILRLVGKK